MIDREKNLQEKETSSCINLLPESYVHGKQCNRWYCSFKFKSYQKLLTLWFLHCALQFPESTIDQLVGKD